ncbi:MAG: homoserine O-acetyltransferase/O-succinyltransferase family protein [Bacteroidales bacterium]
MKVQIYIIFFNNDVFSRRLFKKNHIFKRHSLILHLNMRKKLRIGLLNIMPEAEKYEINILRLMEKQPIFIETVLIKVTNHAYKSSDKQHIKNHYVTFWQAIENKNLDGLIVTGAPVENMDFEKITYWDELCEIFAYAQQNIISTMGICWGGIAIGKYFGINKVILPKKLFGVFTSECFQKEHWMYDKAMPLFDCPQSRYAGLNEEELAIAKKNGTIRLLVNSEEAGHFIFESSDGRFIAHLGHPEYDINRIVFEYTRDQLKGLNHIPLHFDVNNPVNNWYQNSFNFFGRWLEMIMKIQSIGL